MNTSTEPIPEKNIDLESPTHKYVLQSPQGPDKERMFHSISYYRLLSVPFFPERYDKVKHGKAAMQESDAECRITAQKVTVSTARQCTLCRGETEPRPDSSGPSVSVIRSL